MSDTASSTPTPRDAQLELLALVDEVQRLAGGSWANEVSPSPVGCTLTPNVEGVAFTAARTTSEALAEGAADAVLRLLSERGMEAGRRDAYGFVSVLGVHPGNRAFRLELQVFGDSATIGGQSACAPGDVWDELQRVKREVAEAEEL